MLRGFAVAAGARKHGPQCWAARWRLVSCQPRPETTHLLLLHSRNSNPSRAQRPIGWCSGTIRVGQAQAMWRCSNAVHQRSHLPVHRLHVLEQVSFPMPHRRVPQSHCEPSCVLLPEEHRTILPEDHPTLLPVREEHQPQQRTQHQTR